MNKTGWSATYAQPYCMMPQLIRINVQHSCPRCVLGGAACPAIIDALRVVDGLHVTCETKDLKPQTNKRLIYSGDYGSVVNAGRLAHRDENITLGGNPVKVPFRTRATHPWRVQV